MRSECHWRVACPARSAACIQRETGVIIPPLCVENVSYGGGGYSYKALFCAADVLPVTLLICGYY